MPRYDSDKPLQWLECPHCQDVTPHEVGQYLVICKRCSAGSRAEDHSWLTEEPQTHGPVIC